MAVCEERKSKTNHQRPSIPSTTRCSFLYINLLIRLLFTNYHPSVDWFSSKEMTTLHLLLILLLGCGVAESSNDCSAAQPKKSSTSFPLMHVQAHCSPFRNEYSTWLTTMLESIKRDNQRYRAMTRVETSFTTQEDADVRLDINSRDYLINRGFGKPPQSFYTSLDTGSDISWIPCTPCSDCKGGVFDPSNSSTFKYLGCSLKKCQALDSTPYCGDETCRITQPYGDGSSVTVLLSADSLAVGSQSMPGFNFGCASMPGSSEEGLIASMPGLVGFGRKPLSFVSQTAKLFDKTFSYCLPSSASTGCLALGKSALSFPGLQFTYLLTNAAKPSFYYVGLKEISVGEDRVSVPEIDQSSGKGTIIDSGAVITQLVEPTYSYVRDSFVRHLPNLSRAAPNDNFDACFNFPSGNMKVPQITLHFDNNVDVALPLGNVLFPANEQGSVQCLAFAPPPKDSLFPIISILGSYQQRNFRIVYDIPGSRLGIAPENCEAC